MRVMVVLDEIAARMRGHVRMEQTRLFRKGTDFLRLPLLQGRVPTSRRGLPCDYRRRKHDGHGWSQFCGQRPQKILGDRAVHEIRIVAHCYGHVFGFHALALAL